MSTHLEFGPKTSAKEVCAAFADQILGRVVLLTGPTQGSVGYATALAIAHQDPKVLILAGRSLSKLAETRDALLEDVPEVKLKLLELDLGSYTSVDAAANQVIEWKEPIDVLINNAGVMDTEYSLTKDGHEIQLQTNYLSPYRFTKAILPLVLGSTNKTIVNVSSSGHAYADIRWDDPDWKEGYKRQHSSPAYGSSKTPVILWTRALAAQYGPQGLKVFSLDPGGISTPLQANWSVEDRIEIGKMYGGAYHPDGSVNTEWPLWKSIDEGASTTCRAAFDPDLKAHNGCYMADAVPAEEKCKDYAKTPTAIQRIIPWTEALM